MKTEFLPVGEYTLPDGRTFVGLDDVELRDAAARAWRRQSVADDVLARKLAADPARPAPVLARPGAAFSAAPDRQLSLLAGDLGAIVPVDSPTDPKVIARGRFEPSEGEGARRANPLGAEPGAPRLVRGSATSPDRSPAVPPGRQP